jgi:hypothetical protein
VYALKDYAGLSNDVHVSQTLSAATQFAFHTLYYIATARSFAAGPAAFLPYTPP